MFKTKKSRIPAVYRILLVAIAVMAIGGIAVNCYVGNYYRADSIAEAAIDSDREVSVTIEKKDKRIQATQYDLRHKNYTITFAPQDKEKATKALIFYPGGRVQYTAYAPLMHELAKNNFVCILVHMPGNLAVLDQNAADGIIEKYKEIYPSIQEWYMGGHSLGGAMAAEYVSKHVDEFDGLYLFAAYSTADLSDSDLRVFSGSEKEKSQMFDMGAKTIVEKILPVIDNFERGLAAVPDDKKDDPFITGMDKVYKQMLTELDAAGVKPIECVGQEFDPDFHNAVMQVENDELESGTVAQELQKGYMYKDSVVRHSMVSVVQ